MRRIYSLFALCALFLFIITPHAYANNVTVDNWNGSDTRNTTYLPIAINTGTGGNCAYHSVSQQLYYASELTSASSTTINAITFYYTSGTSFTRKLRVWMQDTDLENFATPNNTSIPNMVSPGTKVFSGDVALTAGSSYTITFDTPYEWDGTSNIIVTVFDSTGVKNNSTNYGATAEQGQTVMFGDAGKVRFLHKTNSAYADFANAGWTIANLSATTANSSSVDNRKYVNKITFTFGAAPEPPATPADLSVGATTTSSANLSWSGVLGATSYDLQQSADGENWSTLSFDETGTSYNWTGLSAASTQYARIRANNAVGSSDWSDAITVTTDAVHEHNGITFDKWSSAEALPTSGNYYLANNIYREGATTLTGNLNLCLNGKTATLLSNITIPSGYTLTIYDNEGGGSISGYYESSPLTPKGLIMIEDGGTLILHEGVVQNLNIDPNEGYLAYAIYNKGTLRIAGNPVITAATADIFLFVGKYVTLDGALTNTSPYSINASGQTITSGWSTHMSGEKASDYFVSAKSSHGGVCVVDNEAKLVKLLSLNESADNEDISDGTYSGTICVNLTRSLTSAQYNTFCLPFALDDDQLQDVFGAGYDLEELISSSLEDDLLSLEFERKYALEAGKPYLLQPSVSVVNPSFEGITITATSPVDIEAACIDFKGNYAPTALTGGNKNQLFLDAGNVLKYPQADADLKGFRAYFLVKGAAAALASVRTRIVRRSDSATGLENQQSQIKNQKYIKDGQLFIERNGTLYNAQGQVVK